MKLTYFGTAAAEGWPALFCNCPSCVSARKLGGKNIRTRSQALVNEDLLIDFPADTYMHVLFYGLDLNKVEHLLITHAHEDHLYAEDLANRQEGYVPKEARPDFVLNVYGSENVAGEYERVHANHYNGSLPSVVAMHQIRAYEEVKAGRYTVYPMLADHDKTMTCFIYVIIDGTEGKTLLYAHDTGYFREDVWEFLKEKQFRFDLVSLDCNHGIGEAYQNHMSIPCDAKIKERLEKEGYTKPETKFVVNHFSHNCHSLSHEELCEAAAPYGMQVSYDTMSVEC